MISLCRGPGCVESRRCCAVRRVGRAFGAHAALALRCAVLRCAALHALHVQHSTALVQRLRVHLCVVPNGATAPQAWPSGAVLHPRERRRSAVQYYYQRRARLVVTAVPRTSAWCVPQDVRALSARGHPGAAQEFREWEAPRLVQAGGLRLCFAVLCCAALRRAALCSLLRLEYSAA